MSFDSNEPIITRRRKGTSDDPYSDIRETLTIDTNGKVILTELPSPFNRVTVSGDNKEWYEIQFGIPTDNQYIIDYKNKIATFNISNANKQLEFQYQGTGLTYIPTSMIYTAINDGEITETLKSVVDSVEEARQTNEIITNAESIRVQNEINRENNENLRISKEIERNDAELIRRDNEQARLDSESIRIQSENDRSNAESQRNVNETERINSEDTRVQQESERQTNTATAITNANTASTNANQKAQLADEKATLAQSKIDIMNQLEININQSITDSQTATTNAITATDNTIAATNSANTAITNAEQATQLANTATSEAQTQAAYAKEQGNYAKAQGDQVQLIIDGTGLIASSEKGAANGVATLDTNSKIPLSQLPDIAMQQTHVVSTIAERDAITGLKVGDRVIVMSATDGSREGYIWDGTQFLKDSDTDWANVNLSWTNIIDKPTDLETTSGSQTKATQAKNDAINYTKSSLGDPTQLTTVAKDNFVNVVNELDANIQSNSNALDEHQADYVKHPGYATSTNNLNDYAVTLNPAPTAYVDGMGIAVIINADSTGASTLNVNGLGAKPIKKANSTDVTNLKTNGVYTVRYNSAANAGAGAFILQGEGASGNATASDLLSGKTATTDAGEITGTMPNNGVFNLGLGVPVPEGYYSGGTTANGKRWASGTTKSSGDLLSFVYTDGQTQGAPYFTVTGLTFLPSTIVYYDKTNFAFGVYRDFHDGLYQKTVKQMLSYNGNSVTAGIRNFKADVTPAYINNGNFRLPAYNYNTDMYWIAYE